MAYATYAQAVELYGVDYIAVACDRDLDGAVDAASFDKHLETATREMNGYLLGRYPLPLATPPENFQKICVDIAVYNATPTADVATEKIEKLRDQAISYLTMIAKGQIKLETSTDATEVNLSQNSELETHSTLELYSDARRFRRDELKRLL